MSRETREGAAVHIAKCTWDQHLIFAIPHGQRGIKGRVRYGIYLALPCGAFGRSINQSSFEVQWLDPLRARTACRKEHRAR
jgi:hypothetical protein